MTCIVGYIDRQNKTVVIGADSAGVAGLDITIRKDPKVFQNGDFVIGCTSSFRMIQLLRFSFSPPHIQGKDIYEYMCTDFVNTVRECFKHGGHLQSFSSGGDKGGCFMVAYKDRLFKIETDFQVGESLNGYDAIGCGEDYAKGAIFALEKEKIEAKDRVIKALQSAAFFSAGVCEPFLTINTN